MEPWLNLSDAARLLKVAPKTLRLAAEARARSRRTTLAGWPLDVLEPHAGNQRGKINYSSIAHAATPDTRGTRARSARRPFPQ